MAIVLRIRIVRSGSEAAMQFLVELSACTELWLFGD